MALVSLRRAEDYSGYLSSAALLNQEAMRFLVLLADPDDGKDTEDVCGIGEGSGSHGWSSTYPTCNVANPPWLAGVQAQA
jgi:hypothetical protein